MDSDRDPTASPETQLKSDAKPDLLDLRPDSALEAADAPPEEPAGAEDDDEARLEPAEELSDETFEAIGESRLSIAATCTIAELDALACPPDWLAAPLINQCCRAFLASFKIWKTATVGGNLCMSLPAGPMISLNP